MLIVYIFIFTIIGSVWKVLHQKWNKKRNWENFQFQISFAKLEIFAPALCSHSRHAGKDLIITLPHIHHIFKIMAFFQYAVWLYSGMSAMSANSCDTFWLLHFLILHNQLSIGLLLIKNSKLNNNQIVWNNRRHIDRIYIWARNYDVNK